MAPVHHNAGGTRRPAHLQTLGRFSLRPLQTTGLLCTHRTTRVMGSLNTGPKHQEPGAGQLPVRWPAGVLDSQGTVQARGQPPTPLVQTHTGLHHGV